MDSAKEKDDTQVQNINFGTFQAFTKLALKFLGKFHCIKIKNARKKIIVQMRPLTGEIKNNN